ncbi:MAG: hypothetical protein RR891_12425, partial [Clostridium sp.]
MFLALCTIETLFVNMVITHICSKKKYSKAKTIILITLLTVIVTLLLAFLKYILLDHKITVLCIIGFVYILPLMYVYDEKMDKLIIIMCFTWTYTTLFKTLSFELVNTINVGDIYKSAFIIQTIMYSILTPFLICFIKERFIYLIQKVSDNELIYLKCISIMWFGTAILLDKVYSGNLNIYYKILFII